MFGFAEENTSERQEMEERERFSVWRRQRFLKGRDPVRRSEGTADHLLPCGTAAAEKPAGVTVKVWEGTGQL